MAYVFTYLGSGLLLHTTLKPKECILVGVTDQPGGCTPPQASPTRVSWFLLDSTYLGRIGLKPSGRGREEASSCLSMDPWKGRPHYLSYMCIYNICIHIYIHAPFAALLYALYTWAVPRKPLDTTGIPD